MFSTCLNTPPHLLLWQIDCWYSWSYIYYLTLCFQPLRGLTRARETGAKKDYCMCVDTCGQIEGSCKPKAILSRAPLVSASQPIATQICSLQCTLQYQVQENNSIQYKPFSDSTRMQTLTPSQSRQIQFCPIHMPRAGKWRTSHRVHLHPLPHKYS